MTTKTIKTILFASLIAAMILPFSGMNFVDAKSDANKDSAIEKLSEIKIKQDQLNTETAKYTALLEKDQELSKQAEDETNQDMKNFIEGQIAANKIEIKNSEKSISTVIQEIQSKFTMEPTKVIKYKDSQKIIEKSDIPWYGVGVNELTQKLTIDMLPEYQNRGYEKQIEDLIGTDIEYEIRYAENTAQDWACAARTDDCNPLVGGIKINKDYGVGCTLSLPVKKGTTWGFISAAHCYNTSTDIYQPTPATTPKIGTVTDRVFGGTCDCVFITKSGSETTSSKVWINSNVYTSIVSTPTLAAGNTAMMVGQVTGADWGTVTGTGQTRILDGTTFTNLVTFTGLAGTTGDSGAPLIEPVGGRYYGLLKGQATSPVVEQYVVPWSGIQSNLSVSISP